MWVQLYGSLKILWHCLSLGLESYNWLIFLCGLVGKESTCNVGDLGSVPGLGSSPGEGKGYPLQYSGLENSRDCTVHGLTKSQTWLSNFYFSLSSILAWRILSWTEECGGLQSIGSHRVRHNWIDLACTHASCINDWEIKHFLAKKKKLGILGMETMILVGLV